MKKLEINRSQTFLKNLGFLCAAGMTLMSASELNAASFTWDSTGTSPAAPVAGTGTWSTSNANWSNGTSDVVWANVASTTTPLVNSNDAVITGSSAITVGSAITVRNITNTGTTTISGGTITLDSAAATNTGSGNAGPILTGGTNLTISSIITGTKGLAVGGGTVTLSGANTYTGNTLVSNGTLKLGANNALTTTTNLYTFGAGRTFDLNGFNQTVASINGSNGFVTNTGSAATLTINGSSTGTTGIAIQGATSLVKTGTGTLGLNSSQGAQSYTGSTTISGGSLKLTTAAAGLTATSGVTVNGGMLISVAAGNLNLGIGNVVMSSGAMTPGEAGIASTFTLATSRSLTTTGGTFNFDLGTSSDQILSAGGGVTNTFSLTNTTLALTLGSGFSYASTYNVFSGFASGASSGLTISGYDTTNYLASLSNAGTLSFAAVPEPSTYALLGMGLASLWFLRRRKASIQS